jgi:hypothetical protein
VLVTPACRRCLTNLVPVNNHNFVTPPPSQLFQPCTSHPQFGHRLFAGIFSTIRFELRCLASMAQARWMVHSCLQALALDRTSMAMSLYWPCGQNCVTVSSLKARIRLHKRTSAKLPPNYSWQTRGSALIFHTQPIQTVTTRRLPHSEKCVE